MKNKPHFSDERRVRRYARRCSIWALEFARKGIFYRAHMIDYEKWTKTPEYQQLATRFDHIMEEVAQFSQKNNEQNHPATD